MYGRVCQVAGEFPLASGLVWQWVNVNLANPPF
jgi:hypothetical protein